MHGRILPMRSEIISKKWESIPWPARSPDMNPIEHVWDMLGRRVENRRPRPESLQELRRALGEEWELIPQEDIANQIESMPRLSLIVPIALDSVNLLRRIVKRAPERAQRRVDSCYQFITNPMDDRLKLSGELSHVIKNRYINATLTTENSGSIPVNLLKSCLFELGPCSIRTGRVAACQHRICDCYHDQLRGSGVKHEDTPLINRQHIHFLHDGAPAHFSRTARRYLDRRFPDRWIGRGGPIAWRPRSPDLNPLDFYLWGHLKSLVYSSPVPDLESLRNRTVACSEDIRNTLGVWDRVRRSMRHRCEDRNTGSEFTERFAAVSRQACVGSAGQQFRTQSGYSSLQRARTLKQEFTGTAGRLGGLTAVQAGEPRSAHAHLY
ncbi:hypothetical protein ANN_04070 [Periplaneta americana]|uniref:Tc1-like transposase DDE domain-containing protein n=1 Tax=Periplaneta americana TaxID=6978 RepID=A0ABQ8T7J8_PERAM|nr:hypothetical protein ANN_04070 [Periplaneta americana]